jgi:hypothetical protein
MTNEIEIIERLLKIVEDSTNTFQQIEQLLLAASTRNAKRMLEIRALTNEPTS